jgi:alkylation response protein AidB-like acyl-CoA dehydrogenase
VDFDRQDELKLFRQQARDWIVDNLPSEPRPHEFNSSMRDWDCEWQRRMFEGGWAGIDWPAEYGGRGLSLLEQVIWYEELVLAGVPHESCFGVALGHAGPTLIARASEEQKSFYLPRILKGETPWCQGFSEPQAGSDLASLKLRGVIDGDEIVITGQKIWTSLGQFADYCELLVRTEPDSQKHAGISWLIMDMHAPGVDVRPIHLIDRGYHTCEVFYDEVRMPVANVVGGINNGWSVAMSTLAAERGPAFLDGRLVQITTVDEIIAYARDKGMLGDMALYDRLATLRAEVAALRAMAYYQVSVARTDEAPSAESTAIRAYSGLLLNRLMEAALDIMGPAALEWNPWTSKWLFEFAEPIAGGTKDILRNVIGERILGLPR